MYIEPYNHVVWLILSVQTGLSIVLLSFFIPKLVDYWLDKSRCTETLRMQ
jgi:hypothetical protein